MADAVRKFEVSVLEAVWIKQALENQHRMLVRSRQREVAGSEIYNLRTKEIDAVRNLSARF